MVAAIDHFINLRRDLVTRLVKMDEGRYTYTWHFEQVRDFFGFSESLEQYEDRELPKKPIIPGGYIVFADLFNKEPTPFKLNIPNYRDNWVIKPGRPLGIEAIIGGKEIDPLYIDIKRLERELQEWKDQAADTALDSSRRHMEGLKRKTADRTMQELRDRTDLEEKRCRMRLDTTLRDKMPMPEGRDTHDADEGRVPGAKDKVPRPSNTRSAKSKVDATTGPTTRHLPGSRPAMANHGKPLADAEGSSSTATTSSPISKDLRLINEDGTPMEEDDM
ncbi:hypothetical protein OE88DRAFT_1777015 [Heliocybe sulcata]|uniref:Uncharacterized protein n=1 Tax=Heliocybe sulcata TaxID=5364 RepID=A0A5C3MLJ0_9AGAM|nr:hypothetical protein OE88DRAFT_1777015 [Heliocybe sulcata]